MFKVETPIGYLIVEPKGAKDDYPGVYIRFAANGNEAYEDLVCCVEYDTYDEKIVTEVYRVMQEKPYVIVSFDDGYNIL